MFAYTAVLEQTQIDECLLEFIADEDGHHFLEETFIFELDKSVQFMAVVLVIDL